MGKTLVLAEKPSVARDIAKVLNCNRSQNGFIEGDKYIITWALGHLVTLADPEIYDDKYKTWDLSYLPMLPNYLKLVVIKDSSKQFKCVKDQLYRNDVSDIVIATDAGREGELVARWIIEKANIKKPIKRLWISSQTDKAIKEGFNSLKPGSMYDNLYKAAKSRAEADWIVGLNVTRALTCKFNAQLSAGRVQSPTLSMIVDRENERINFKPRDYFNIHAKSNGFTLHYHDKDNNTQIFDEDEVKRIIEKTKGHPCKVIDVTENLKKQNPPSLYDLTELQRDGNRIFGYSAKQTLSIMQRLYENYKILTYPRTDSKYISSDIVPTIPERLRAISTPHYKQFVDKILQKPIKADKSFVDDSKVSDHHAIIPTEQKANISLLSDDERNIFDLVVKRFLSNLFPQYEYIQKIVKTDINGETFTAKGNTIKVKGWKEIYEKAQNFNDEDEKDSETLPDIKKGDVLPIKSIEYIKLKTKPPERFTEASLLSAMENPQKYVNMEKNYAKTLGETGGIGTVATRADIIEKLFSSFYIEKNNKEILPTSKGKQLLNLVPKDLKSPLLTAEWEMDLES
ncbi:MAG: DNA topoisomerase III, partial [Oscillospiraceae bacterium]|nr:DNA topoisomerase III [Oscillospiraceae bacterium]